MPRPLTGLVAICRGLTTAEAPAVGDALYEAGIRAVEVPLNSPSPFDSIALLAERLPEDCIVGAGTVVAAADVDRTAEAGGTVVLAPNTDAAVISRAATLGLTSCPGVATATDVFTALHAGATALKIFPADVLGIGTMKAWSAVAPKGTAFLPVGGVDAQSIGAWRAAGAVGAGIGSALYTPGREADEIGRIAAVLVAAWEAAAPGA